MSSQIKNPLIPAGRVVEVANDLRAVTAVAGSAERSRCSFQTGDRSEVCRRSGGLFGAFEAFAQAPDRGHQCECGDDRQPEVEEPVDQDGEQGVPEADADAD